MTSRTARLALFSILLLVHGAITLVAMETVGFIGIFQAGLANWGAGQVFSDLSVLLVLISVWMLRDAKKQGVNAWPFIIASLGLGSISPLAYLLWRELRAPASLRTAAA